LLQIQLVMCCLWYDPAQALSTPGNLTSWAKHRIDNSIMSRQSTTHPILVKKELVDQLEALAIEQGKILKSQQEELANLMWLMHTQDTSEKTPANPLNTWKKSIYQCFIHHLTFSPFHFCNYFYVLQDVLGGRLLLPSSIPVGVGSLFVWHNGRHVNIWSQNLWQAGTVIL
jgi:hypothetical protein